MYNTISVYGSLQRMKIKQISILWSLQFKDGKREPFLHIVCQIVKGSIPCNAHPKRKGSTLQSWIKGEEYAVEHFRASIQIRSKVSKAFSGIWRRNEKWHCIRDGGGISRHREQPRKRGITSYENRSLSDVLKEEYQRSLEGTWWEMRKARLWRIWVGARIWLHLHLQGKLLEDLVHAPASQRFGINGPS